MVKSLSLVVVIIPTWACASISTTASDVKISMSGLISLDSLASQRARLMRTYRSPHLDVEKSISFHTFVAKLLFLSKCIRPDLLTLVY